MLLAFLFFLKADRNGERASRRAKRRPSRSSLATATDSCADPDLFFLSTPTNSSDDSPQKQVPQKQIDA
jgi:hypothetical protein